MFRLYRCLTILSLALLISGPTAFAEAGEPMSLSESANVPTAKTGGDLDLSDVPGSDICVKLQNALALLPRKGGVINTMMFAGDQPCSVNPFSGLRPFSNEFHPWIRFGNVDIQTSVPWVALSTIVLTGVNSNGNYTRIDYVGAGEVPAVMTIGQFTKLDNAHSLFGATINGVLFTSSHGTAEDGLLIESTHHSEFNNISAWGMTNCGIETKFAVTDTFNRPKVSALDATESGYRAPAAFPKHDFCFGGQWGYQTTDGTVIDPAAEGSTVSGIWLSQASSMTFLSGTAEGNRGVGVEIDGASAENTFVGIDLEANSGGDLSDGGNSTQWINIIATGRVFFAHSCDRARIIGGNHKTPSSESLNCPAQLDDHLFQNTDSKTQRVVNQRIASFAGNEQPSTGNAIGSLIFGQQSTVIYPFPMLAGKPWRLVLMGVWNNTADRSATPMPGLYTEVSSDQPTVMVGSLAVTFSLNDGYQLQGKCTRCTGKDVVYFSGTVVPLGSGYMIDTSRSIQVQGSIDGASFNIHGNRLASTDLSDSISLVRFVGTLTTTAATTDSLKAPGVQAGAMCSVTAQNPIAASFTGYYVPPVAQPGTVMVVHHPVPGAMFSVFCQ